MRPIGVFLLVTLCLCSAAAAQEAENSGENTVSISYSGSGGYRMVERTDLSRYLNGKYTGLTRREVRSFIDMLPSPANAPQQYAGTFY
ncbi:MAG: hypothetical protein LBU99_00150, partial [Spirochaetaceae bacterium]|nr:hypothetical protein [Spirochaetaceae bacterium]